MELNKLFNNARIVSISGDVNQGKSMLIYHILHNLKKDSDFKVYAYGLRLNFPEVTQIYSVAEMEQIKNSFIIIDELSSLFDLDNRKIKKQVENTLRLINHNNNVLLLAGTSENFKKFISAKIDLFFFKKSTLSDFINGSNLKNIVINYKGNERGAEVLNLEQNEAIVFDGLHYNKINIPYYKEYDTKKENVPVFVPKNILKKSKKRTKK